MMTGVVYCKMEDGTRIVMRGKIECSEIVHFGQYGCGEGGKFTFKIITEGSTDSIRFDDEELPA